MATSETQQPRAYSYLRFSTPEQLKGDSQRRQIELAEGYAAHKGLKLDDRLKYHDLGKSAFHGDNQTTGRLGEFLAAVNAGEVPVGSYLLVESLDRISRQNAFDAQIILSQIINAGIIVITLLDGREYSRETVLADPLALIYAILMFTRANEESETKSRRLKQAWKNKRARIEQSELLTKRAPAWLEYDERTRGLRPIPERAGLIEHIFESTLVGVGQHRLVEEFNRDKIKPWGRATHWQRSYIAKILKNPAVIGSFTPHTLERSGGKRIRKPLEPIAGYFPPVISKELWDDVQALSAGRRRAPGGRQANGWVTNVLAALASCSACGRTVTRVTKGSKGVPRLVCVGAKQGLGCRYQSARYDVVESAIVTHLPSRLGDVPAGEGEHDIDAQLNNLDGRLEMLFGQLENALELETKAPSSALTQKRQSIEEEIDAVRHMRETLLIERAHISGKLVAQRVSWLAEQLAYDPLDPAALNAAMRAVFKRVVIDMDAGLLELEWTHGGTCELPFASGFPTLP